MSQELLDRANKLNDRLASSIPKTASNASWETHLQAATEEFLKHVADELPSKMAKMTNPGRVAESAEFDGIRPKVTGDKITVDFGGTLRKSPGSSNKAPFSGRVEITMKPQNYTMIQWSVKVRVHRNEQTYYGQLGVDDYPGGAAGSIASTIGKGLDKMAPDFWQHI